MAVVATVDVLRNILIDEPTISIGGNCVVNYANNLKTYTPDLVVDRPTFIVGQEWLDQETRLTLRFDHTYYNSVDGGGV